MSLVLGIESTCDETAASVVQDGTRVLSNVIASQVQLHQVYKGVVPEIASRAHIENILPVLDSALSQAGTTLDQIDAVAVAQRPGLIGSLLIGVTAAKTLAWSLQKPLIGVDHVQAHLYSVRLSAHDRSPREQCPLPAIGLVCSGGHTALYHVRDWTDIVRIGQTIDDAVGEAYDKVAAILNLPYPGGPVIDRLAEQGNPEAIQFPRSYLERTSLDFSFSGLKTSVLYHVRGHPGREKPSNSLTHQQVCDVCASFQQACVDVLMNKIRRALERYPSRSVVIGGGVSANRGLRAQTQSLPVPVYFPEWVYCTDNAAMIAGLGQILMDRGFISDLSMDAMTSGSIPAMTD
ncbi:MAG: tRNA N6-adenosine threonylcarbamoyltransferase [Phycisphaerae bacterium]|jgi:N6-L-threonylcarbamoyladenine synthase|nr:MAG: tRNA N6-adenosine threonylcarbamoyltransferase [Phycisphaerae bacterium]